MGLIKAIKAIGRGIGRGVEKVGDFFGSSTISVLGMKIQDACAEKIGSEKSYQRESANIYTTDRLNDILVSVSDGYFKQATSLEDRCIEYVEKYYDVLFQMIEDAPELSYNKANLQALKRGKNRIKQNITGGLKEPLAKRMSLDDSECLKILKMESGSEKTKAMSSFSQKVITEALNNLAEKVRLSMNEQLEDIEDYLENISDEQEKEFSLLKNKFEKMYMDGNIEVGKREIHCVQSLIIINALDMVSSIL